jgi:hypothetical protein
MSTVYRNARGQYQLDINSIEENSLIGNVVREEVEAFITKLRARLNTLSAIDLTDDETSNFKDEIRSVLRRYMGGSTAKAAVNFVKKPNSWNLFCHDNYERTASQIRDQEQRPMGMTFSVH